MQNPITIGAFTLGRCIGRGGQSSVFCATHTRDHTPVALKVLRPGHTISRAQFHREVSAAARLDHSCITAIFDHGVLRAQETRQMPSWEGLPWLAMELVEGRPMSAMVGRLTWPELRQVLLDTLDGLAHAHARGTLHLDIKPGNLLRCDQTLRSKITDFGLVRHAQDNWNLPAEKERVLQGTPAYMSPEQISLSLPDYGPWTDVYALGATAWRLATGTPVYSGDTREVLQAHLRGLLPPFCPVIDVPDGLEGWLRTTLTPAPRDRFHRASDASWALHQLGDVAKTPSTPPMPLSLVDCAMETVVVPPMPDLEPRDKPEQPQPGTARRSPPPCPSDWRPQRQADRHLHAPGLSLLPLRSIDMVGRLAERDFLWAQLQAVHRTRTPRVVVLRGAVGVGRATLGRWVLRRADETGAAQFREMPPVEGDSRQHFVRHLLSWNSWQGGLSSEAAIARIRRRLQPFQLSTAHIDTIIALTGLLPGHDEDTLLPPQASSALCEYLRVMGRARPLLLLLPDLHRHPFAQVFLETLVGPAAPLPVLVVATAQTDAGMSASPSGLQHLLTQDGVSCLDVQPLTTAEIQTVLQQRLGLHPGLASVLAERCKGDLQTAVNTVLQWVAQDALTPESGGFVHRETAGG